MYPVPPVVRERASHQSPSLKGGRHRVDRRCMLEQKDGLKFAHNREKKQLHFSGFTDLQDDEKRAPVLTTFKAAVF